MDLTQGTRRIERRMQCQPVTVSSPFTTLHAPAKRSGHGPSFLGIWETDCRLALARAKAFLPLLQSSNADLLEKAKADPNGVNIEHTDGQDQVIAMVSNGVGCWTLHAPHCDAEDLP